MADVTRKTRQPTVACQIAAAADRFDREETPRPIAGAARRIYDVFHEGGGRKRGVVGAAPRAALVDAVIDRVGRAALSK